MNRPVAFWEAAPQAYRTGQCYSDFWHVHQAVILHVHQAVILEEQHPAVGMESGETAHVECWNHTLRQQLVRFVRITPSLRISVHADACLNLLLYRYNLE